MATDTKRYFVKNIPPSCTESELTQYFYKLGNISDVSINSNDRGSFAFLTVENSPYKLDKAVATYNSKMWKDHKITLEMAKKESFITRLKREQAENLNKEVAPIGTGIADSKPQLLNGKSAPLRNTKKRKYSDSESESEVATVKLGVPKFTGLSSLHVNDQKGDDNDEMASFAAFDSMWQDKEDNISDVNNSILNSIIGKSKNNNSIKNQLQSKVNNNENKSKPLTKTEKKWRDDERRKQSIIDRASFIRNQKKLVKAALSSSNETNSRKIIFDQEEPSETENTKKNLFDDDDDEPFSFPDKTDEEFEKTGKLIQLQSRANYDERFKLDERFLDDNEESQKLENHVAKKTMNEMVRYDPTKKNVPESSTLNSLIHKQIKKADIKEALPVSKETFYEVSETIKTSLGKKAQGFSLLETYGNKVKKDEQNVDVQKLVAKPIRNKNPLIDDSSDEELFKEEGQEEKQKKWMPNVRVCSSSSDKFFFDENDSLFREAMEFINKKNSIEAKEAFEKYDQNRKDLKRIVKQQIIKRTRKNDMFSKKIGGMKKNVRALPTRGSRNVGKKRNNVHR